MSVLEKEVTRIAAREAEGVVQQVVEPLRIEIRKVEAALHTEVAAIRKDNGEDGEADPRPDERDVGPAPRGDRGAEEGGSPMKGYLSMLVDFLPTYPASLHRHEAIRKVRERLIARREDVPASLENAVQSTYNRHCEGYAEHEREGGEPLFKSGEKGSDYWSVHPSFKGPLSLDDF